MISPSLDLRSKILFGSLLLIIPLMVALTFVYQYGSAQIRAAQAEAQGVTSAAPLWEALFASQIEADREKTLISEVLAISDRNGLVLDPDLASYYLIIAMYQTVPTMLENLTNLRPLFGSIEAKLADKDRLLLYSRARELQSQSTYLADQIFRSTRASDASTGGPIPGYTSAMQGLVKAVSDIAAAVEVEASGAGMGGAFDAATFESRTLELLTRLRSFQAEGTKALMTMLDRRIAATTGTLILAFALAGLGLVFGGALLLYVVAGIRRRAFSLVGSLATLAQNNLTRQVPPRLLRSKDELGRLAGSVQILQGELKGQIKGLASAVGDLADIGSTLGDSSEQSSAAIEQMSAIATTVARAADTQSDQTAHANQIVAEMVEGISNSNELTQGMASQFFLFSQSMEANRNRIRETAAEAQATGVLAEGLDQTGSEGEHSLENLKKSIQGVVQKTGEIQEIVQFILDIADRTNLLSMNAAIEAAHAGSAGRGFSIVADEIRKLAEVSSKQAQTIKSLLEGIAGVVDRTLTDSEATARSFQTLRQDITTVKYASTTIANKMAAQQTEDENLSSGLHTFAEFYGKLSEALDHQIDESKNVKTVLETLETTGREISLSMRDQKIGMEKATEASIQVRETALNLTQVIGVLEAQMSRYKT